MILNNVADCIWLSANWDSVIASVCLERLKLSQSTAFTAGDTPAILLFSLDCDKVYTHQVCFFPRFFQDSKFIILSFAFPCSSFYHLESKVSKKL